jgi:hypothetical protein
MLKRSGGIWDMFVLSPIGNMLPWIKEDCWHLCRMWEIWIFMYTVVLWCYNSQMASLDLLILFIIFVSNLLCFQALCHEDVYESGSKAPHIFDMELVGNQWSALCFPMERAQLYWRLGEPQDHAEWTCRKSGNYWPDIALFVNCTFGWKSKVGILERNFPLGGGGADFSFITLVL